MFLRFACSSAVHTYVKLSHVEVLIILHESAPTLKPLTAEMDNIGHLSAVQYSAGKPRTLTLTWLPLDVSRVPKYLCRSSERL